MRLHLFLLSFLCLAHLPCCFSVTNPLVRVQCNASLQTIALQSIWFETRRKGRGGERAREGVIRHTLMYAHRHTHRHRHTDTHTQTHTHKHRQTDRQTDTHTHTRLNVSIAQRISAAVAHQICFITLLSLAFSHCRRHDEEVQTLVHRGCQMGTPSAAGL